MILYQIVGARPNFIKAAPINEILNKQKNIENFIIHTGQHYDYKMSKIFFDELKIPSPNYNLNINSKNHGEQIGKSIIEIEKIFLKKPPNGVIVYGDVNATLSGAIAAAKLNIPVFHIESGCRSFDKTMPEEVNRILTDNLSSLLFCTENSAKKNLRNEGFDEKFIRVSGNVAIDSLIKILPIIKSKKPPLKHEYIICTLHRPFNVDNESNLELILSNINKLDRKTLIPAHPRLFKKIKKKYKNIIITQSMGYLDFISALYYSSGVISDSGGIQCEASFLKKPMLTLRPNTEHLLTLKYNNKLINEHQILDSNFEVKDYEIPKVWDGLASNRIIKEVIDFLK